MRTIELKDIAALAATHSPQVIDVYFFDGDTALLAEDVLDSHEKARCARFVTALLRDRYRHCHNAKRAILASYLQRDPAAIGFEIGRFDKPKLRDSDLHFNLSHAENCVALAIATDEIGIDCERVSDRLDLDGMVGMIAHPSERIEGREAFFRTWTRKEAVMKQLGLGFQLAPERMQVPNLPEAVVEWQPTRIDGAAALYVLDVPAPHGFFSTVAAPVPREIRVFRLCREGDRGPGLPDPTLSNTAGAGATDGSPVANAPLQI